MLYKQRDVHSTAHQLVPLPIGNGWTHNWFSYVHFRDQHLAGTPVFSSYDAVVYSTDGSEYNFSSQVSTPEISAGLLLSPLAGSTGYVYPITNTYAYGKAGARVTYPDGSQDIYGYVIQNIYTEMIPYIDVTNPIAAFDALLTERIDPAGNSIQLTYTNIGTNYVLQKLVDYDGNPTAFSYTNIQGVSLLDRVDMPYGRSATLVYNPYGFLTDVYDSETNRSSFDYWDGFDYTGNWYLKTLTLPYSGIPVTFNYYDNDSRVQTNSDSTNLEVGTGGGTNRVNRAITVTLQDGSQELYLYRWDCSGIGIPAINPNTRPTSLLGTLDYGTGSSTNFAYAKYFRNSFHWNRKQYAQLTHTNNVLDLTTNEYGIAEVTRWMVRTNWEGFITRNQYNGKYQICPVPSWLQEGPPSGTNSNPGELTWYDYSGKPSADPWLLGDTMYIGDIARVLPDRTTWYEHTDYDINNNNFPAARISTYTLPSGAVGTRTNTYLYQSVSAQEYCSTNTVRDADVSQWFFPLLTGVTGPGGSPLLTVSGQTAYRTNTYTTLASGTNYVFTRIFPYRPEEDYTDAAGYPSSQFFNTNHQVTARRQSNGLLLINVYSNGSLSQTRAYDSRGANIALYSFGYSNGLLSGYTNALGLARNYTWDSLQRLTGVTFPQASSSSYISNVYSMLALTSSRDRLGNLMTAGYDIFNRLQVVSDFTGTNSTLLHYCTCGALESVADPAGVQLALYGITISEAFR